MKSIVEIIEIGERAPTGVSSNPFRCIGDDGNRYFVKLGNARDREKTCEWMGGFLAHRMGLHTPVGRIVFVDEKLSTYSAWDTSEFGFGIGYGSEELKGGEELSYADLEVVSLSVRSEILLFDWWIRNEDRKLGELGGNPNILKSKDVPYCLIDHGNAFDAQFDEKDFFRDHACQSTRFRWREESARENWLRNAEAAMIPLKERWDLIPEEWFEQNFQMTFQGVLDILHLPWKSPDAFWAPFS